MTAISGGDILLHERHCIPCEGGTPPLGSTEIADIATEIHSDWKIVDEHHLLREWAFADFATALTFLNEAARLCELEGHHADFELAWGRVQALIYTHKIDGLTESDFVLAAKFDRI